MPKKPYTSVSRGEIYMYDWDNTGAHPALVIQNSRSGNNPYNTHTMIAYITSAPKRDDLPMIVKFKAHESNLSKDSAVDLEYITTIRKSRLNEYVGKISTSVMAKVDRSIRFVLDV